MSSIFSVGVLSAIEDENLHDRVEAVYGGSAGAVIGAYFLTRQLGRTRKIYSQDLSKTLYRPGNIPKLIFKTLWSRFVRRIPPEKLPYVISLDAVMDLMTKDFPLNVEYLKNQPIPLYSSFLDIDTGDVDYLDIRRGDTLLKIKAAINAVPGCYHRIVIKGKSYIDGAIKEPFSVKRLLKAFPDNRILMIANENIDRPFANRIKGKVEGLIAEWMLGRPVYNMFARREEIITEDLKAMQANDRVYLVNLPLGDVRKRYTTNQKNLESFFDHGVEKGRKAVKFIKGEI